MIVVTHFDLANNYGPPYGSAEETFGQILLKDERVTSVLVGVSSPAQMQDNVDTIKHLDFTVKELKRIAAIIK